MCECERKNEEDRECVCVCVCRGEERNKLGGRSSDLRVREIRLRTGEALRSNQDAHGGEDLLFFPLSVLC